MMNLLTRMLTSCFIFFALIIFSATLNIDLSRPEIINYSPPQVPLFLTKNPLLQESISSLVAMDESLEKEFEKIHKAKINFQTRQITKIEPINKFIKISDPMLADIIIRDFTPPKLEMNKAQKSWVIEIREFKEESVKREPTDKLNFQLMAAVFEEFKSNNQDKPIVSETQTPVRKLDQPIIEDNINLLQSKNINTLSDPIEVEPEFFSYDSDKKIEESELISVDELLPSSVAKINNDNPNKDIVAEVNVAIESKIPVPSAQPIQKSEYSAIEYSGPTGSDGGWISKQIIQPIHVSGSKVSPLYSFQVVASSDVEGAKSDNGAGEITLAEKMKGEFQQKPLTIESNNTIATNFILNPKYDSIHEVPVLSYEFLENNLISYESEGKGIVIFEMAETIEMKVVDDEFAQTTCFSEDFKKTSENCRYVVVSNITAGNRIFQFSNDNQWTRFLNIRENEAVYYKIKPRRVDDLRVSFVSRSLLTESASPMHLSSNDISLFFQGEAAIKLANDTFTWRPFYHDEEERIYLKLENSREPLYVGLERSGVIEVPTEDFMREVIGKFQTGSSAPSCLIQINLTKPISASEINVWSYQNSQIVNSLYLDRDGKFYDYPSEQTQKIFIFAENTTNNSMGYDSKIHIKLTYPDKSQSYLSSFCSPETYLLEQL